MRNITEGIDLVNEFAAEHLQIYTQDPMEVLGRIRHAGEIILGGMYPFQLQTIPLEQTLCCQ